MLQHDLQKELDRLFKFNRNTPEPYLALKHEYDAIRGQAFTNIEIKSADFGVRAVAAHLHHDSDGVVIYEYAYDRVIRKVGPQLAAPIHMLQDCEHHYYGLKLNCLALMCGHRIKSLVLRDSYNGESLTVRYNPLVAQIFLSTLTHTLSSGSEVVKPKKQQFGLFAA